ncbi:MAG TPA: RraA family protein, partial [Nitrospira sp.]|nr:RraA family protein [Nitrospira sp.]
PANSIQDQKVQQMADQKNPAANFDVDDVCQRFSVIYTGAISDVLDEMGHPNQVLPWEIQGLTIEHRVAGVAMPVEGQPTESRDPEEIFVPVLKMLGDLKPGDVIVSQPHDSVSAHIGELSAESAKHRGARGAVIDGGARDTDYLLKLGFPVFCRYRTPRDIVGRWKLVSYGQPIQIGKVAVHRGDFVVGDQDGVLVIPREITLEVLRRSEEVMGTENLVRKAILGGVRPLEAYREYGRF